MHAYSTPGRRRVLARQSRGACEVAGIDCKRRACESACGKTAEVAANATDPANVAAPEAGEMATLKRTDRATSEPADIATPKSGHGASPEPADPAAAKPAASDEITSNPASHMTASPAVASASSAARRRDVRRRSGQGDRKGKDDDPVQHRTLGSLHAWDGTLPRQPPRELQRQIRDPAVNGH